MNRNVLLASAAVATLVAATLIVVQQSRSAQAAQPPTAAGLFSPSGRCAAVFSTLLRRIPTLRLAVPVDQIQRRSDLLIGRSPVYLSPGKHHCPDRRQ
jgi:hypothetical protein